METIFDLISNTDTHDVEIEKKNWKSLTNQLAKYQKAYDEGAPLIDDDTYDDLFLQLQTLEKKYGILSNSPSIIAGYNTSESQNDILETSQRATNSSSNTIDQKHNTSKSSRRAIKHTDTVSTKHKGQTSQNIVHIQKMLSLDQYKVLNMSTDEIEKGIMSFMQKINRFLGTDTFYTLICEPKVDGVSLSLRYEKGKLISAALRGNGVEGENVLENIIHLNIPQQIDIHQTLEVRGELFMSKTTYHALQEKGIIFASPRHAVSGSVRLLNSAIFAERGIQFVVHGIATENYNYPFDTYSKLIQWLESQNFPTFQTLLRTKVDANNQLAQDNNISKQEYSTHEQESLDVASAQMYQHNAKSDVAMMDANNARDIIQKNDGIHLPLQDIHTDNNTNDKQSDTLVYFHATVINSLSEASEYFKNINNMRELLDYNIDGVVYKINNVQLYQTLLYSHKYPRYAFAIKFPSKSKTSRITDIRWQIGRTGAITPVIEIESVHIDGANISNITMHNVSEYERYRPMIGDIAIIEKAGDVIPAIIDVIHNDNEIDDMRTNKHDESIDDIESIIDKSTDSRLDAIHEQEAKRDNHGNFMSDDVLIRDEHHETQSSETSKDVSRHASCTALQNEKVQSKIDMCMDFESVDMCTREITQENNMSCDIDTYVEHQKTDTHTRETIQINQSSPHTASDSIHSETEASARTNEISISDKSQRDLQKLSIPQVCPECHSTLIRDSKVLLCINPNCRGKLIAQLIYSYSRDCLNIEGLADQKIIFLFDQGLIKYPVDIFTLTDTCIRKQITLEKLPNWGRLSAKNLLKQIEQAKTLTFDRFLLMLGIEYLGKRMSEKLAQICNNWDDLIQYLQSDTQIGLGSHIKNNILQYHAANFAIVQDFLQHIQISQPEKSTITYKDIRVVFTGKFQISRQGMKEKAHQHGVQVFDSISKNTTYLVYGDDAGSKLKQAKAYDIKCVTYDEWQAILLII